jgi:RNA polymerase sigma-70 factor, ECF subfamily
MATIAAVLAALPMLEGRAHNLARDHHDAQDLLQDTLVAALQQAHKVPHRLIQHWLMRVMYHRHLNRKRRGAGKRGKYRYDDPFVSIETISGFDVEDPGSSPEYEYATEQILGLIAGISPAHREVLEHVAIGGDLHGLSEATGVRITTLKSRAKAGRSELRRLAA